VTGLPGFFDKAPGIGGNIGIRISEILHREFLEQRQTPPLPDIRE